MPRGSISLLLDGLKGGDGRATQELWDRYCDRLVRLARDKLRNTKRRVADEEDVALNAFHSLCVGAKGGRFPALTDRGGLWGLLVFITAQKAAGQIVHWRRKKRGGGKVRGHSVFDNDPAGSDQAGFDRVFLRAPGPATLNVWAEEYQKLIDRLGDDTLRKIAELSVQGYSVGEIAERLGRSRRMIHLKLRLIREISRAENSP